MADFSYIGSGQIYLKNNADPAAAILPIGNCSKLSLSIDEEIKELMDYTSPGGGTMNEVRRIKGVTAAFTMHDLDAANIALAIHGDASSAVAGSVTDEVVLVIAVPGYVKLAKPGASAVVVTNLAGTTTYVAGTDYEVKGGGLYIPSTSAIVAGQIKVDYAYPATFTVEALMSAAKEYELVFDGLNEARTGKSVVVHLYRTAIGAAKSIDLIADDFVSLEVEGKVLKDTTKGAGVSAYFRVQAVS